MDYSYDTLRSFQEFKIKAFRFFNDYDTVYFHCELLACHRYSPNSRCGQGCSIANKRKKRDVTRDEVEHEESTNKVILTQGPLVFKKEEQQSGDTDQNKQTGALIGGVAAAGGFGLIAIIALAVLFVKYRIARRFMNRNKVGDLYTTQDQQLSRRHAYIQEDDMIDKEDTL
ncbi:ZP domain-containing protein-like [Orbicella faveolata]|uniref:ZP domain-containing protein-like n=1 Tax=Orbicella faveolata TaxID=48498 RepID=UPI0009E22937|nr:ZP domain-containing protein-like [Orbicella faveolata]